jgi:predicted nucleic acid-binding protein
MLFLDTSALVKVYVSELGSERMREAARRDEPKAASVLVFAEMHATFARRRREELLTPSELAQVQRDFGNDWERLTRISVVDAVLRLVPGLCERHSLRGADAVHLASALLLHEEGLEIIFACSDRNLLGAVDAEGLVIFDPALEAG